MVGVYAWPPKYLTPPCTSLIPLLLMSVVPSFVSTLIYLCGLTFSLRPDEVASV